MASAAFGRHGDVRAQHVRPLQLAERALEEAEDPPHVAYPHPLAQFVNSFVRVLELAQGA